MEDLVAELDVPGLFRLLVGDVGARRRVVGPFVEAVDDDPSRLGEIGVKNPGVLANSLHRMWGKSE